jgi:ribosomal protein L2
MVEERPAKMAKIQPNAGVIVQLVSEDGEKAGVSLSKCTCVL